jgi:5-methylcytosine-specific restriction endonuclease McrA
MNELPYIDTPTDFQQELKRVALLRKNGKLKERRLYRLTKEERKIIHAKTGGKCHVCGQEVSVDKFEADHVKSYSSGGTSVTDNFLPACRTCNNYRWHYLPDEFKWILKLGVWARTEIAKETEIGKQMVSVFVGREKIREARRRNPRISAG